MVNAVVNAVARLPRSPSNATQVEEAFASSIARYRAYFSELPTEATGSATIDGLGSDIQGGTGQTVLAHMEGTCRYATVGAVLQTVEIALFLMPPGGLEQTIPSFSGAVTTKVVSVQGGTDTIEVSQAGSNVGDYNVAQLGGRYYITKDLSAPPGPVNGSGGASG